MPSQAQELGNEDMGRQVSHTVEGVPERFVPAEMHGELVEAEHIARYRWATAFCEGRRVLDAGCGVGYGAGLLRQAGAAEVVAVDLAEAVIEVARNEVPEGVICEVADLRSLTYPDESFDLVVCFEVIEHVEEQDRVLDQLARVLRPDGLLLISSPNRGHYVPGNPHHKHEYVPAELRAALEGRFGAVRLLPQHAMLASVIGSTDEAPSRDARVERLVEPEEGDEIYTLAIAGTELPGVPTPMVALTQFLEVRKWLERFQGQDRVLREQAQALRELETLRLERREALDLLARRELALSDVPVLRERLAQAAAALPPLVEKIEAQQEQAEALKIKFDNEMARATRLANDMRASLSWRITAPLRRAKRLTRSLGGPGRI
jgi:2-polyprenyl-3-methyl-5-hydroxy-6-metoxy-1,4-benzoquinol methylase